MEKSSSSKNFDNDRFILFGNAIEKFQKALQSYWSSPDHEKNVIDSYTKYSSIMQEAMQTPDVVKSASEAYAQYERSIKEAFDSQDVNAHIQAAFEEYLQTIGEAWANIDISSMTPQTLGVLAEGMSWVASVVDTIARLTNTNTRGYEES